MATTQQTIKELRSINDDILDIEEELGEYRRTLKGYNKMAKDILVQGLQLGLYSPEYVSDLEQKYTAALLQLDEATETVWHIIALQAKFLRVLEGKDNFTN